MGTRQSRGCHTGFLFLFKSKKKKNVGSSQEKTLKEWCGYSNRTRFCFAAKFTAFPRNVTATEGQNVEMSCAFQSGSASVYLEIQWWFLRGPEDLEPGAEVAGAQVAASRRPQRFSHSLPYLPSVQSGALEPPGGPGVSDARCCRNASE